MAACCCSTTVISSRHRLRKSALGLTKERVMCREPRGKAGMALRCRAKMSFASAEFSGATNGVRPSPGAARLVRKQAIDLTIDLPRAPVRGKFSHIGRVAEWFKAPDSKLKK